MEALGAIGLAVAAGFLSFASPCCLPLIPGYVSYISGVAGTEADVRAAHKRSVTAALLFVSGFSLVFVAMGATASVAGQFLLTNRLAIMRVAGIFVILMGLLALGFVKIAFLQREYRMDLSKIRRGPSGAMPLGMAFAVGWTPCIGPVLAGILTAAGSTGTVGSGAGLLLVYSLGLSIPFILVALGFARVQKTFKWLRRHGGAVEKVGGLVLITMGLLMVSGEWLTLIRPISRYFSNSFIAL